MSNTERDRAIGILICGTRALNVARTFQIGSSTGTTAVRPKPGAPHVTTQADDNRNRLSHLRNGFRMATHTAIEIPGRNNRRIMI